MSNTLDVTSDEVGFYALFKGPSGSGKTVAALSWPNLWMADLDQKMPAIARKHFPKKSIEYEVFPNCFSLAEKIKGWINNNNCPYETLLFDSITSLCSLIIRSVGEAKGESAIQLLQQLQVTAGGKKQVEMLGVDYYNAETRYIDWFMDATKILYSRPGNPKHVLFTAHILTVDSSPDLKTKVVTRTRSIVTSGKKVAAYIPTQFDDVFLFGTSQEGGLGPNSPVIQKHKMLTITNGEDDAKTAFFLSNETDFTNEKLYDLLMAQIKGKEMFL